jgi:poly(A) polymerase
MTERNSPYSPPPFGSAVRSRIAPPWMAEPATQAVLAAFAAGGAEAWFVGGAVRDALLGDPRADFDQGLDPAPAPRTPTDIDIATPASPDRVMELLQRAGIRAVPTGLAHGTVTAVVPPRHFEITTLRRDVETYGRQARVVFDADWKSDAARRDFTINAIYLDPGGTLHDPVGGLADLAARRVRFVGDPATRIAEDVLRLLRYYRFEACFGEGDGDAAARAACRAAALLLRDLSAERVTQELMRLLASRNPSAALQMMQQDGVLAVLLPEARRLDRLRQMIAVEPKSDALLRLAALVEVDSAGAMALAKRLRFTNAWYRRLQRLAPPWPLDPTGDAKAQRFALYRLGADDYRDLTLLLAADRQMTGGRLAELLTLAQGWTRPVFSLNGRDVTALGIAPGERVGQLLNVVRNWWEEGDFVAGHAECLAYLRRIAQASRPPKPDGSDAGR